MSASKIEAYIIDAVASLGLAEKFIHKLDIPVCKEHGDFATNAAIVYAKRLAKKPIEIADQIVQSIKDKDQGKIFKDIQIAKPGFINFFVTDSFLQQITAQILLLDKKWGEENDAKGENLLIEFVSANPTGPLHIGHGRWAVIGDVIARLLEKIGYRVEREYYVNNIGNQVNKLWDSIAAVREGKPVPEGGYGGNYVIDIEGNSKEEAIEFILRQQKATLNNLGVSFSNYFSEKDLHQNGKVQKTIEQLKTMGKTFEEDGALWFKSQEMGDDKNRVLVRENGETTYFAADIAYHSDKFERGFDRLIDIWGTDHHGYVSRLKGALKALNLPIEKLEVIIGQMVTLYRGNEPVRMSKRTGEMITLQEVIDEIGSDSVRFFFSATDVNSHLDFDLELAKKKSADNPVYYVQYAHARICSILRKAKETKSAESHASCLAELNQPAERALMLKLMIFPDIVKTAAALRHPHRITEYGKELSTVFHYFYEKCRVIGNPARTALADAARITLRNVLELLGISAPENM